MFEGPTTIALQVGGKLAIAETIVDDSDLLLSSPAEFLTTNATRIREALLDFSSSPLLKGVNNIKPVPLLYPRLYIYTFVCCACSGQSELIPTITKYRAHWQKQPVIKQLSGYKIIKRCLLDVLDQCQIDDPQASEHRIERILDLDVLSIVAKVLILLSNRQWSKEVIQQDEVHLRSFMDLLQGVLDFPRLYAVRPRIMRAIVTLTEKTGLIPSCLILNDVEPCSNYIVDGGAFGYIRLGKLRGQNVAIKVIRSHDSLSAQKDLVSLYAKEAVLWRQFHHTHVLPFYGVYLWPTEASPRIGLVSPWLENGNIMKYLELNPEADRLRLLVDIAEGVNYLHVYDPPIIHGDLKGNNILIMSSGRACIADFGLSKVLEDATTTPKESNGSGALPWLAPELVLVGNTPLKKTLATDIYAFGCVCYEIYAGYPRFHGVQLFEVLTNITTGIYPLQPNALTNNVWDVTKRCWAKIPGTRPTSRFLLHDLVDILNRHEANMPVIRSSMLSSVPDQRVKYNIKNITESVAGSGSTLLSVADTGSTIDTPVGRASRLPLEMQNHPDEPKRELGIASWAPTTGDCSVAVNGDQTRDITNEDLIVAVMGPSGAGKSSFINKALNKTSAPVGHGLSSCTVNVQAYECAHPRRKGQRVVLVDTPGFEDSGETPKSDFEVLAQISDWLSRTYRKKIQLNGIIILHRISDDRLRGTPLRNLSTIQRLCGDQALGSVTLCTTMWDSVEKTTGMEREVDLRIKLKDLFFGQGCQLERFEGSNSSAWRIIDQLDPNKRIVLDIQKEMVTDNQPFRKTAAFTFLFSLWTRAKAWRRQKETLTTTSPEDSSNPQALHPSLLDPHSAHQGNFQPNIVFSDGNSENYTDRALGGYVQVLGATNAFQHASTVEKRVQDLLYSCLNLSPGGFILQAGFDIPLFRGTSQLVEEIYIQFRSEVQTPLAPSTLAEIGKVLAPIPGRIVLADATEIRIPLYNREGNCIDFNDYVLHQQRTLPLRTEDLVREKLIMHASTVTDEFAGPQGLILSPNTQTDPADTLKVPVSNEDYPRQPVDVPSHARSREESEDLHPVLASDSSERHSPSSDEKHIKAGNPGGDDPPSTDAGKPYIYFDITTRLHSKEGDLNPFQDLLLIGSFMPSTSTANHRNQKVATATVEFRRVNLSGKNHIEPSPATYNLDILQVAVNTLYELTEVKQVRPKSTLRRGRHKEVSQLREYNATIGGSLTGFNLSLGRKGGLTEKQIHSASGIKQRQADGEVSWRYALEPDFLHDEIELSGPPNNDDQLPLCVDTAAWPCPFVEFAFWEKDGKAGCTPPQLEAEILSFWSAKREFSVANLIKGPSYRNMLHRFILRFPSNPVSSCCYKARQNVVLKPAKIGNPKIEAKSPLVDVTVCSTQIVENNSRRRWVETASVKH